MLGLGPPELIIIAIVILALFGYKKLPDAARAVGRSARILKAETKGLREDPAPRDLESRAEAEYRTDYRRETTPPPAAAPVPPPVAPAPQPYSEAPAPRPVHVPPPSETR
jgi:sec-independent protein translocase protein TatA